MAALPKKVMELFDLVGKHVDDVEVAAEFSPNPLANEKPHWPRTLLHEGKFYTQFSDDRYVEFEGRTVSLLNEDGEVVKEIKSNVHPAPKAIEYDGDVYFKVNEDRYVKGDCLKL